MATIVVDERIVTMEVSKKGVTKEGQLFDYRITLHIKIKAEIESS